MPIPQINRTTLERPAGEILFAASQLGNSANERAVINNLDQEFVVALENLQAYISRINSLEGLAREALRNRLGKIANGKGFNGLF